MTPRKKVAKPKKKAVRKPTQPKESGMARDQSRVDQGRRELGARINNHHVPSKDREGDGSTSSDVPASILLTLPAPGTLAIGGTMQMSAVVLNAASVVLVGVIVTGWQSGNEAVATVDGNGLVTGVAAGSASMTATYQNLVSNTVAVAVLAPVVDNTPNSIAITPTSGALVVGGSLPLVAAVKNAAGTVLPDVQPDGWQSADTGIAAVSNVGVVTAVGAGGPINVTATLTSPSLSSNACAVTVTADNTGGGGGSNALAGANEPAGFTQLNYLPCDVIPPASNDGGVTTPGWLSDNRSGNISVQVAAGNGGSSDNVLQMLYPAGFPTGGAPGQCWTWSPTDPQFWPTVPRRLYMHFRHRISSNWFGNDSGNNKVIYAFINNTPSAVVEIGGVGSGTLVPEMVVQGIQAITGVTLSGGAAILSPNINAVTLTRGTWYEWEVLLVNNTSGNADGAIQLWINGTKAVEYLNVQWTVDIHQWEWMTWDPIYGGLGNPVPADQYQQMKDLYVSGKTT